MAASPQLQPGLRIGNYILQSKIGEGAFSVVWKATHHERKEVVALKIATDPSFRRQLVKEARLASVRHDAVVPILDSDTRFADLPYVVMPYYEGGSLADLIAQHPTGLPLKQTSCVLISILEGVSAAHGVGIVHRDLKPSNVLFHAWEAEATVADFGLSLIPDSVEFMRSMAQSLSLESDSSSGLAGTLAYMPPEIRDGSPATPAADVFSIGVLLFEMLTGRRPCGPERPSDLRSEVGPPALWDRLYSEACSSLPNRIPDAEQMLRRYLELFPEAREESDRYSTGVFWHYCAKRFPAQTAKRLAEMKPDLVQSRGELGEWLRRQLSNQIAETPAPVRAEAECGSLPPSALQIQGTAVAGRRRAVVAIVALFFCALAHGIGFFSDVKEGDLLASMRAMRQITPRIQALANENDERQAKIAALEIGCRIVAGVLFLYWWYRAYANCRILSGGKSKYSPGWAVGYWFVPVFFLFRPYQIAKEMWRLTATAAEANAGPSGSQVRVPAVITVWWLAWVFMAAYGSVFRGVLPDRGFDDVALLNKVNAVEELLGMGTAILAMLVVHGIHVAQEQAARRTNLAVTQVP